MFQNMHEHQHIVPRREGASDALVKWRRGGIWEAEEKKFQAPGHMNKPDRDACP